MPTMGSVGYSLTLSKYEDEDGVEDRLDKM
jgi:hypothetical protein